MTEEQYWDKDCCLVKFYREADKLRKERMNQELWLQGMYFYDALSRVSPILRAFGKKGTKPQPYVEEPYPITKQRMEETTTKNEHAKYEKGLRYMQTLKMQSDKKKGSGENANDNRTT